MPIWTENKYQSTGLNFCYGRNHIIDFEYTYIQFFIIFSNKTIGH